MSTGDFATELRQSVQDHIALVHTAAKTAKARIGQSIPRAQPVQAPPAASPPEREPVVDSTPRPAVNFFADEPAFDVAPASDPSFESALDGRVDPLPEGAISFEDSFVGGNVDDEGIPVWEDAP
jgi:hypothetical protein